jgi:hypothetical protein
MSATQTETKVSNVAMKRLIANTISRALEKMGSKIFTFTDVNNAIVSDGKYNGGATNDEIQHALDWRVKAYKLYKLPDGSYTRSKGRARLAKTKNEDKVVKTIFTPAAKLAKNEVLAKNAKPGDGRPGGRKIIQSPKKVKRNKKLVQSSIGPTKLGFAIGKAIKASNNFLSADILRAVQIDWPKATIQDVNKALNWRIANKSLKFVDGFLVHSVWNGSKSHVRSAKNVIVQKSNLPVETKTITDETLTAQIKRLNDIPHTIADTSIKITKTFDFTADALGIAQFESYCKIYEMLNDKHQDILYGKVMDYINSIMGS